MSVSTQKSVRRSRRLQRSCHFTAQITLFGQFDIPQFRDNMPAVSTVVFVISLFLANLNGSPCDLKHCMKCHDGSCTECEYGWYGTYCTQKCQNCWFGGCEQSTGRCKQCTPGYYTESCNKPCPRNCRLSYDNSTNCNRTTGHCLEGCEVSYWGFQCDTRCNTNCEKFFCEQKDGKCLHSCTDGWFGETCNKTCPDNCRYRRCSFIFGECSDGCEHGFHGRMCDISCHNCIDEECTVNELTQVKICSKGCKDGWTFVDCRCSSNCQSGTCENNGSCKTCKDGYHGDICADKCPQECPNSCEKTGQCPVVTYRPNVGNGFVNISSKDADSPVSEDKASGANENISAETTHLVILVWFASIVT